MAVISNNARRSLPPANALVLCVLLYSNSPGVEASISAAGPSPQSETQAATGGTEETRVQASHQHVSTTDHKAFKQLNREFKTGQEVTRVCLSCHTKAAKQLHKTKHWRWDFTHPQTGQALGKRNIVNNFCGSITTNYAFCTSCHISYGWKDANFNFTSEEDVACIVCHDTTGTYRKFPVGTGHPNFEDNPPQCGTCHGEGDPKAALAKLKTAPIIIPGANGGTPVSCDGCHGVAPHKGNDLLNGHVNKVDCQQCHAVEPDPNSLTGWKGPDLTRIARNVGLPKRRDCGNCHFHGGGGNAVKHGDLDNSLVSPKKALDVHMDEDGLDFTCATCHRTEGHEVPGSRYAGLAKDTAGIVIPGREFSHASCESCHGLTPHPRTVNNKMNDHIGKVACQSCHIPAFARGGVATLISWDWSTAGKLDANGRPLVVKKHEYSLYDGKKGDFLFAENVIPEYHWYNGEVRYTLIKDTVDPNQEVKINEVSGNHDDPKARIWPFKAMRGKQPYDKGNKTLVVAHLFGHDDTAYWENFDWDKAIRTGMSAAGAPYSGEYGFVRTIMYWPITHMVAPKEDALACDACHSKNGRLKHLTGFYMPGRDSNRWLELIGWAAVLLAIAGVLVHIVWHATTVRAKGRGQ